VAVEIGGALVAQGCGSSKRRAEQDAAARGLEALDRGAVPAK